MGALSGLSKAEVSSKLAEDTVLFMENGGTITLVPYDDRNEKQAMVGVWQRQGDMLFDDLGVPDWDDDYAYAHEYDDGYLSNGDWHDQFDERLAMKEARQDASKEFGDSSLDFDEDTW